MSSFIKTIASPFVAAAIQKSSSRCFFFFSSRRRHTRSDRDWSSDVCSSDLTSGRDIKNTRLATNLCKAVTVVTNAARDLVLQTGARADRVWTVPCGLVVPQAILPRSVSRKRLGIPDDKFVIATAARLVKEKGIGELIEAA